MTLRLAHRRVIWWPTCYGWTMLLVLAVALPLSWWFKGETFLASSSRLNADVLVVEGWIGNNGITASVKEFRDGKYRYVVATGGLTGESWSSRRWNYAVEAEEQLLRSGIPREQVILGASRERGRQRTYEMALSAREALKSHHIEVAAINVFTRGAHARRSRLVFQKVMPEDCDIGVISWYPEDPKKEGWWHSSERAEDMIKETVGYVFEFLLDSGRAE
jgi:hypothetical protein